MEYLEIQPGFMNLLSEEGLRRFRDFMRLEGVTIGDDGVRRTMRLEVGGAVFYLKRTRRPGIGAIFGTLFSGTRPHGMAFNEMLHARELAKAGFDVMEVVAGGERRWLGWPCESFVMTREVKGEDLDPFFRKCSPEEKRLLVGRFAGLLGRLHLLGFYARVRMKDILIGEGGAPSGKLHLIDREVRHPFARAFSSKKAVELLACAVVRHHNMGIRMDALAYRQAARAYAEAVSDRWPVGGRELFRLCRAALRDVRWKKSRGLDKAAS